MKGMGWGMQMRRVGRAWWGVSTPSALFHRCSHGHNSTRSWPRPGSNRFRDLADTSPAAVWFSLICVETAKHRTLA